jgi:pimeloyl-ACP methyl ester carboxylesterase
VELPEGGHMAPMSHPQLVNPIIANYLDNGLDNGQRNSS